MSHRTLVLTAAAAIAVTSGGGMLHAQQVPPAPADSPAPAAAAGPKERARALHAEGLRHYEARRYGRAISAYRKAYAIYPAAGILFNLAQAYRLKGDCRRAHRAYKSFLHADGNSAQAALAREHASALSACAARAQKAKEAREAAAASAAATPPPEPTRSPILPPPAAETQVAAAPPLEPTPSPDVAAEPAPALDLTTRRDVEPGRSKKLLGVGVGTAGAALLVVGIYYGLQARSAASELDDFFAEGGTWTPELGDRQDSLGRDRLLSIGFGVAGAGAVGAGAVLYWMGRKEAAAARLEQPPVTIAPRPDGATLLWRRTF